MHHKETANCSRGKGCKDKRVALTIKSQLFEKTHHVLREPTGEGREQPGRLDDKAMIGSHEVKSMYENVVVLLQFEKLM
ncbi:hypothetical protein DPMN_065473 [Dreissena polymorpha]|uniref:Uncharacterized protein n=1 Tax=Dreissena polymorpha TaxID=45954 RepID=A0A9D3YS93_DREPO|nr:hypothetical protein DPMN_065473 [Dreissena polymorpha]